MCGGFAQGAKLRPGKVRYPRWDEQASCEVLATDEGYPELAGRRVGLVLQRELNASIQRIESLWFVIALRDNPPSVEVFDVAQLPADFMVCPPPPDPRPDKRAILAALKAGQAVPGARMVRGRVWRSNEKPRPFGEVRGFHLKRPGAGFSLQVPGGRGLALGEIT